MSRIETLTLPLRYLGTVDYFASLSAARRVYIDPTAPFNKRDKEIHRTVIADANGVIRLTVPLEKPQSISKASLADLRISAHDQWWNIHFTALASAYGRTPYFEYYADDFRKFYTAEWAGKSLVEYVAGLNALVCKLIDIPTEVIYAPAPEGSIRAAQLDIRQVPYWQVRALRQGFIPSMSIADLLFNLGPEAILLLEQMII